MAPTPRRSRSAQAAFGLLLAYVFSLAFIQPQFRLLGFLVAPGDVLFVALGLVWAWTLVRGETKLAWDPAWVGLLFYFAAMALSLLATDVPQRSATKIITQVYLLSIPIIAVSLIDNQRDLRQIFRWWLTASAIVAAMAVAVFLLFYMDRDNPLLGPVLYRFGTLIPGNYPRFQLSFANANMLANYLSVSLMILLVSLRLGWMQRGAGLLLMGGILFTALFTVSPGLGGIALVGGWWLWLTLPKERRIARPLALAGGVAVALLFLLAMAVTPILHSTAPYLIRVPLLDLVLAPSGRLMIWTEAVQNFLAAPLIGRGIGANAVLLAYQDPSGNLQRLTDAHNSYLNIAVQCGIPGLIGLLLITAAGSRAAFASRIGLDAREVIPVALGIAFVSAFAYQGLGGSFEDARHLWLLFGLVIASRRLERQQCST